MKIYLVGGAVRDKLLGLPVTDRDWVVVGARQNEMLDLGFAQVGNDFPVFLHPQTKKSTHWPARSEKLRRGIRDLFSMPTKRSP